MLQEKQSIFFQIHGFLFLQCALQPQHSKMHPLGRVELIYQEAKHRSLVRVRVWVCRISFRAAEGKGGGDGQCPNSDVGGEQLAGMSPPLTFLIYVVPVLQEGRGGWPKSPLGAMPMRGGNQPAAFTQPAALFGLRRLAPPP